VPLYSYDCSCDLRYNGWCYIHCCIVLYYHYSLQYSCQWHSKWWRYSVLTTTVFSGDLFGVLFDTASSYFCYHLLADIFSRWLVFIFCCYYGVFVMIHYLTSPFWLPVFGYWRYLLIPTWLGIYPCYCCSVIIILFFIIYSVMTITNSLTHSVGVQYLLLHYYLADVFFTLYWHWRVCCSSHCSC